MNEKIEELRRIMSASRDDEMKEARRAGGVKLVFPTDIVQEYFEGYAHALRDLEQMFPEKPTVHTLASAKDERCVFLKNVEADTSCFSSQNATTRKPDRGHAVTTTTTCFRRPTGSTRSWMTNGRKKRKTTP